MKGRLNTSLQQIWSRWGLGEETAPVTGCVHYGAFRYDGYNPYEAYLAELVRDGDAAAARRNFTAFLQHYRPRHFGEALGLALGREQPLWQYPWNRGEAAPAWVETAADCPDILTHFLAQGIPRARIAQEFLWLEEALDSVRRHGFQPRRFRSSILARKLVRLDGATAYLLLDGNHRVAALAALGVREVAVSCPPWLVVRESRLAGWPQVRAGRFSVEDARRVFHAYFDGNRSPRTTAAAAPLLEGFA